MTKQEAIKAMGNGLKVTHRYFDSNEWITMKDGMIVTEEDYKFPPEEFWRYRQIQQWLTDWEIKNEEQ